MQITQNVANTERAKWRIVLWLLRFKYHWLGNLGNLDSNKETQPDRVSDLVCHFEGSLYTKIRPTEANISVFVNRLFHEDISPIIQTNYKC